MSGTRHSSPRPRLAVGLPVGPWGGGGVGELVDVARALDAAGVDTLVAVDHVVTARDVSAYPGAAFPFAPDTAWPEPLALLAAVATATTRCRLSTGIVIAGLRGAALMAKTAATVDSLSGGRLELGVGVGWQPAEYQACGLDVADRGHRLDDTVRGCRELWTGDPASLSTTAGPIEVWCRPQPAQARLPVLFAGRLHSRNVRRIVELGDGWIPLMGTAPDEIADGVDRLQRAYESVGRDPAALRVRTALPLGPDADLDPAQAPARRLWAAGVTEFGVQTRVLAADLARLPDAAASLVGRWSETW